MYATRTESELRHDYYRAVNALDQANTPDARRAAVRAALHSLNVMSQRIADRTGTVPGLDAELAALERMLDRAGGDQIDENQRRNAYFFLPRG